MVITSLNLYDFSEQNNREMGILVSRQDEKEVFEEAVREVQRIMSLAQTQDLRQRTSKQLPQKTEDKVKPTPKQTEEGIGAALLRGFSDILLDKTGLGRGFCIGCKTRIAYDEYKPFCPDCFKIWAKNKSLKANHCHDCGRATTTSMNKPVCRSCWGKTLQHR